MKKAEIKEAEGKAELYPLSKKEFEDLYDKAWDYGWVYGRFFQELYDEYLVNWVYFVDYLDVLKGVNRDHRMYKRVQEKFVIVIAKNQQPILIEAEDFYFNLFKKEVEKAVTEINVEILIGEAPPYWKGNAENKDKSYFYNPSQINNSPWLNGPANWKSSKNKFKSTKKEKVEIKIEKLNFLAKQGLILFDIFPFPIIQDTKIRQAVSGKFPEHINEYFIPKLKSIIKYIGLDIIDIKYGFVATTYGSLHLLFGDQTRELFYGFDTKFYDKGIEFNENLAPIKFVFQEVKENTEIQAFNLNKPTALFKYIYKLICPESDFEDNFKNIKDVNSFNLDIYVEKINQILKENMIPILMDGSGNVNFTKFFNYKKLTETFEENKPED